MQPTTKKRLRTVIYSALICVAGVLAVGLVCFVLITRRPENYNPLDPPDDRQVSPYLTHHLATEFHNNLHRDRPFDLLITQPGLNDIIARGKWPRTLNGSTFSAPAVIFAPDRILLMGTVAKDGLDFVVTVNLVPRMDALGRLKLEITAVRAGALDITALAKNLTARIVNAQAHEIDRTQPLARVLSALVTSESFEPVLQFDGRKLRIDKVKVAEGTLRIGFAPVR